MIGALAWLFGRFLLGWVLLAQVPTDPLARFREAAKQWEPDIQQLEQLDQSEVADNETILFLGSSSIRRWESLPTDLPRYKTLRRAYGGARFSDLAVYIDRLIARHQPRAVVVFVANDISGDPRRDLPPDQVVGLAQYTRRAIRRKFADIPIFFIAITPTPSRFAVWDQVRQVNCGLAQLPCCDPHCYFLETASRFLDEHGKPRAELFVEDQLHLNEDGYQVWAELFDAAFRKVLPTYTPSARRHR